ncbi:MAG: hypothetical protein JOZ47_07480 [Kutzneria sp.]|nr:hypothetical protein [Kutzneria sp.]MBV9844899.1 hypothetical protein [Kutzneria sp.]
MARGPGSVWDGRRYTRGHADIPAAGLEPLFSRPSRDFRRVHSWWTIAAYSVLAATGEAFDVISAPLKLGVAATRTAPFRRTIAPASLSPDRLRFLVAPGVRLGLNLAGVELVTDGALVPMPPTRVREGHLTWWVSPRLTQWKPGDSLAVQAALWLAAKSGSLVE